MNTRFLPALVLLLWAAMLPAQVRHITTDKSPSGVFAHGGFVHVLTAGVDLNFNGSFEPDSGDVPARWFVIDPSTDLVTDSVTFEGFFNSYPIRAGVDSSSSVLYLAQLGRVRSFDLNTRKLLRDTVALGNYSGVSFEPYSRSILCHMRTGFSSPGYVVAIQSQRGDTLGIYPAGLNPQMSVTTFDGGTQGPAVYTLNEGTYTKPDASISFASGNNDIYAARNNNRKLGGGASYLATRGTTAYVVLNGTHQIRMIDARQHTELPLSPINVGTSGFDGPRSLAFQTDEIILVPTYAGDLRRFNTRTGQLYDSVLLHGKGESVVVRDTLAFVTIKYGLGGTGYDPDSTVAVVGLNNTMSVVDTIPVGIDPGTLFFDKRGDLHVLGYGKGDTAHWWMVFDGGTFARKSSRTLAGTLGFPLHVAYDETGDSLYVVLSDSLFAFSAADPDSAPRLVYTDSTASGDLTNVTIADSTLLITELPKNFSPDPGYVHVVNLSDGKRVAKFLAGPFLTMAAEVPSLREHAHTFYALNEGTFGSPSSTLALFQYSPNIFGGDSLGKGANHLAAIRGEFVVTMNGDHKLVLVKPSDWRIEESISTGTSGFDGPRETIGIIINGDLPGMALGVTTYAGDFRVVNYGGGVSQKYETGGKAEGVVQFGRKYYVANAFTPEYSADSTVAIIDVPTSVEEVENTTTSTLLEQNFPNPVTDHTTIRFSLHERGNVELTLYTINGELVKTLVAKEMEPGSYSADIRTGALPAGRYIYTLRTAGTTQSKVMEVVR